MAKQPQVARTVAVLGLGRFGAALALELEASGTEVMGVDNDHTAIRALVGELTQVIEADAAQEEAAENLGLADFDRVVVAIGGHIVASCLASSTAVSLGLEVWAKAVSKPHARILHKLGVQHVIFPEQDMGKRVAHLVRGGMLDYVEFSDDYAMVTMLTPPDMVGKPLGTSRARSRHGVTVVALTGPSGRFDYATTETVPGASDRLIVSGATTDVDRFSALAHDQAPTQGSAPRSRQRGHRSTMRS